MKKTASLLAGCRCLTPAAECEGAEPSRSEKFLICAASRAIFINFARCATSLRSWTAAGLKVLHES